MPPAPQAPTDFADPGVYPTLCPECRGPVWDAASSDNHIRQHWPRFQGGQPETAKAAVRIAYLRGHKRPYWTVGEIRADKEADDLGVVSAEESEA